MSRPPEPLFLARQTYRRRRLGDAALFLPAFGVALLLLPILWADDASTRGGIVYIFSVWAILIALVFPISMRLSERVRGADGSEFRQEEDVREEDQGV